MLEVLNTEDGAMEGLEATNVFIDSSVFIGKNYQYGHPSFKALKEAVAKGRVKVLIVDVTIDEVKAHIQEEISQSIQTIKKARGSAKILRNLPEIEKSAIFENIDSTSAEEQLFKQLDEFLLDIKAKTVSVSDADTSFVFECYFKHHPPFASGKKKNEFPDAFVLSALSEWAEGEGEDVYIVSHDYDMAGIGTHFPRLIPIESLEKFLDKVTSYFEKLAPVAQRLLQENLSVIEDDLKEQFRNLGFVLADQDGDVNDVSVAPVGDILAYLISLKFGENGGLAEAHFELTATITYEADVSYDNLDTARYDSEDKVLIPWETVERTVEGTEVIQADLKFSFNIAEPHDFGVEELYLHTPKDVCVSTEEDDGWPYK